MKHNIIHKAVIIALLAFPVFAGAGVNPKNGNFYITYNDATLKKDGHELSITRTYNSMATESGWFGYGWGSLYESRLVVLPDGSAAIKENGTGRTNYYHTDNEAAIKAGVKRIVAVATQQDNLTPAAAADLAIKLLGDEELRLKKVTDYGIYTELPKGAALGNVCGKASLTRVAEGYRRVDCDMFGDTARATDTFDLQGRLMRHELTDGYAVTIRYADSGTPEIRDTLGQIIGLVWTPEGRVANVKANKEETTYSYNENGDLVTVADTIGNIYRYSYDDNHNLTQIMYGDGSVMTIDYFRKTGIVTSVTNRNSKPEFYGSNIELGDPEPVQSPPPEPSDAGDIALEADDFMTAFREWKSLADKNPAAQFKLALMYYKGIGVTQDLGEALKGIRKSADAGYSKAQVTLGVLYEFGEIVEKDPKEAVHWYRMAADQNNAEAQTCLGLMYSQGAGVAKDLAEAATWYRKAVTKNNADAQFYLGDAYLFGKGVSINRYEAVELLGKAAYQGQGNAQFYLGEMYRYGNGVRQDKGKSKIWYRKAADQGHLKAKKTLQEIKQSEEAAEDAFLKDLYEEWR